MNLYIAEKPSLARAIADVMPKPHKKEDGFIRVGNGDCISWCVGHLLEQAEPDAYDAKFKQWRLEHLPILPQQWQLKPKAKTKKQLSVLKKLINQADQLIHAGDPDREGQLLVDQVIAYHKTPASKRKALKRCLISDMNPAAVRRALEQLRDNKEFVSLSTSALARTRADWLYGINMTRAYTVQGRKVGYDGVLSVGRVQTPVLGLVVQRDKEIESFVSKPFFEVYAHLRTSDDQKFIAKWKPSEACRPYMDDEGRVLLKKLAENVIAKINSKPASVKSVEEKLKKQPPPLPYNLSALQIDAAKRYGLSAKQVLDYCQSLYEKHKLITYPRSSSRHLPQEHFQRADNVISAIMKTSDAFKEVSIQINSKLKSQAWNDKKVEAHHAIIPTEKSFDSSKLNNSEKQLYELIARQYLYQFLPKHEYLDTRVEVLIEGGLFIANAKRITIMGWKLLAAAGKGKASKTHAKHSSVEKGSGQYGAINEESISKENINKEMGNKQFLNQSLPALKKGDALDCQHGELVEKQTQPPLHFTDATLLSAMTGIARFVKDPNVRKVLRETDGIGTEATRASIIELLFKRGYLVRQQKSILATPAGQGLIQSLPEVATKPDMTAEWESTLDLIATSRGSYEDFMGGLTQSLDRLLGHIKITLPSALKGIKQTASVKPAYKKRWRKKSS